MFKWHNIYLGVLNMTDTTYMANEALEHQLYENQQAVESHITKITELQTLIAAEEEKLANKIGESQAMVNNLLKQFSQA